MSLVSLRRSKWALLLFAVIWSANSIVLAKTLPPRVRFWAAVNSAYEHDNIKGIGAYRNNSDSFVRFFSRMAIQRLKMNYMAAYRYAKKCINLPTKNDVDKYMHLVCLSSLSALYSDEGYVKKKYEVIKEVYAYVSGNKDSLARVLGGAYVNTVLDRARQSGVSGGVNLDKWPTTTYAVKSKWEKIALHDGFAKVRIAGKPVYFMVDTGTSGININYSYARKIGLLKALKKIGARGFISDFSGRVYGNFYVAPYIEFGPIRVKNAYIGVGDNMGNVIGLNYLMRLKRFVLSRNSIVNKNFAASSCYSLNYFSGGMEFGGYAITANIRTSKGSFNVLLDTGTRTQRGMPKVSLFLYSDSWLKVFNDKRHEARKIYYVTQSQHGRWSSNKVQYFKYRIDGAGQGVMDRGLIDFSQDRHRVGRDGVVGYNILYSHRLYVDFKERRLCFFGRRGDK